MSENTASSQQQHWQKTRSLTIMVLVVWAIFGIVLPFFANVLNSFPFLGFPLGYYLCVQGSLIVFVVLIVIQNWRQDQIDDEFGVGE